MELVILSILRSTRGNWRGIFDRIYALDLWSCPPGRVSKLTAMNEMPFLFSLYSGYLVSARTMELRQTPTSNRIR